MFPVTSSRIPGRANVGCRAECSRHHRVDSAEPVTDRHAKMRTRPKRLCKPGRPRAAFAHLAATVEHRLDPLRHAATLSRRVSIDAARRFRKWSSAGDSQSARPRVGQYRPIDPRIRGGCTAGEWPRANERATENIGGTHQITCAPKAGDVEQPASTHRCPRGLRSLEAAGERFGSPPERRRGVACTNTKVSTIPSSD